jgi:anti-sigma28 factor (negative regulator of flagellin synthesis)
MSDTNRYITRRSARPAPRAPIQASAVLVNAPSKVEALRKLVAAGQYQVNARWLATRICRVAGVKTED